MKWKGIIHKRINKKKLDKNLKLIDDISFDYKSIKFSEAFLHIWLHISWVLTDLSLKHLHDSAKVLNEFRYNTYTISVIKAFMAKTILFFETILVYSTG